jgi:ABC-2 type transport system permease protein
MTAIWTLWQRELVRFYRDRSRLIGALTPPIVFWFVIGSGVGTAFRLGSLNFLQYFFSGTLVLIVLFTSIFATISIIEDRREGFLQSVLVAPIPRLSIVLGKVLGASTVGFAQGLTFLVFAPLTGLHAPAWGYATAALALLLCSVGLTGLGFCIAWKLDSTQGFHAVMNLFLIPMWMLSGALFPLSTAPGWLRAAIRVNPVTYGVAALQQALTPGQPAAASLPVCLAVLAGFAVAMLLVSAFVASRRDSR